MQDLLQSCSRGGRGQVEDMRYVIRRAEACAQVWGGGGGFIRIQ